MCFNGCMAWKNYRDMSPEEKKASWGNFRSRALAKKKSETSSRVSWKNATAEHEKKGHSGTNPGGYCKDCGFGRDYS